MNKQVYEIDGSNSSTLEEFAADFTDRLNLEIDWRGNLDAFNDILHGGFGTPDEGFILIWRNSALSRQSLGYPETIKWLKERIQNCHPSNVEHFKQRFDLAQQHKGETIFDMLVRIITDKIIKILNCGLNDKSMRLTTHSTGALDSFPFIVVLFLAA